MSVNIITMGFHALSEPIRIEIIELLQVSELCVCDLCTAIEMPQSKISFHLKILKEARLVDSRQEGRWMYYSLNRSQFVLLQDYLKAYTSVSSTVKAKACL